jgi:hypothetical protein
MDGISFTSWDTAPTISMHNVWIDGMGGGSGDATAEGGFTEIVRGSSNAFFKINRVSSADTHNVILSNMRLRGALTDTADFIDTTDFNGTSVYLKGFKIRDVNAFNVPSTKSAFKLYNPDTGCLIRDCFGNGLRGKLVHIEDGGANCGNTTIDHCGGYDMQDDNARVVYAHSAAGGGIERLVVNDIHAWAPSSSTATTTAAVEFLSEAGSTATSRRCSISNVKTEAIARVINIEGISGGSWNTIRINNVWYADARTGITATNKLPITFGVQCRNSSIRGASFTGTGANLVETCITDNNSDNSNPNVIFWDAVRFDSVNNKFGGTSTKTIHKIKSNILSGTFTIDATGEKSIAENHNLPFTPDIQDFTATPSKQTNVTDWRYGLLVVDSVSSTQVTVKINVTTASATGGATAKMNIHYGG